MSKAATLPPVDTLPPRLDAFLRENLPEKPKYTVAARVLLRRDPSKSNPVANPGEF